MITMQVLGCNVGFGEVLGDLLSQARRVTNMVMNDETVELQVAGANVEHRVLSMRELGAQCGAVVGQG